MVGVGKVVSATDVFALVQENIINLPLPGLVKVAAITTIIAGITGSASGGLTIALELFGETFISWGYTPEIIHRLRRTGHPALERHRSDAVRPVRRVL